MFELNEKLKNYVDEFNKNDDELYIQKYNNADCFNFLSEQIPLIDIPDKAIEKTYYFRWWTYRKQIKDTPDGCVITEFLPNVCWAGAHNTIVCPACFHIREGRWLKDSEDIIKNYIDFWLSDKGDAYSYSSWLCYATLEYCTIKNDFGFGIKELDKLINFFETRKKKHVRNGGIYWSNDDRDGMEFSISGKGLRTTINSYAYADAIAISVIAEKAGKTDIAKHYKKEAEEIKENIEKFLWDKDFYKTIPLGIDEENPYTERPVVNADNDCKELVGFVPWYFNIPKENKEQGFAELFKEDGFFAKHGITTAVQRHPRFMEEHDHECLWNGPVWPFATSQVLVAFANLLRNYNQNTVDKDGYYKLLLQYAENHVLTLEDGTDVPWIDENMHPYSGIWLARELLKDKVNYRKGEAYYERGKDYNHSLFCDLVLSGLLGLDCKDGELTVNPLIPENWDYFKVENLYVGGKKYTVTYDKYGSHYGKEKGIKIETH